jgi:hypothetical protein
MMPTNQDDLASLGESLAILSDPEIMAEIRESERQLDDEPGGTLAEVRIALHRRRDAAG